MPKGRPSKGPRRFMATRLPVPVADALEARADRDGVTITDALERAVTAWLNTTDERQPQGVTMT